MFLKIVLCALNLLVVHAQVTEDEYGSMPILFHMDNYDNCMLMKDQALYCSFIYKLEPINSANFSNIWNTIKEVSSNPKNYRHDHLRHWICVPNTCPQVLPQNLEIMTKGLTQCYDEKYQKMGLKGLITNLKCQTSNSNYYRVDTYDVVVAIIIISYIIMVILASFYEGIARYKTKEVYAELTGTTFGQIVSSFSLPKNWYRLTSVNTNPDVEKLRSIQGMRFYTMICVIMSHTAMTYLAVPVANPKYAETMTENYLNMFLANGGYVVQTFFLVSGWLLSFHFFQMFEGRRKVKFQYILLAFINRYIRLTPTLAVVLAFHSTWLVHLSNGPLWDSMIGVEYRNCRKNWWTNLLYINNYIDPKNMCLQQTWYIASDTQLFLLSLFVLMVMWRNPKKIKLTLGICIVVGILIPGVMSFVKNYDIIVRQYPELVYEITSLKSDIWLEMYSSGYCNIGGYMIGLMFGYIYYKNKDVNFVVKKIHVIFWYILTFGMCIFVVLIAGKMYENEFTYTRLGSALYWAFGRNMFAIGIGIAIFGMTQNIGYFAKWFCEWHAVQIFARLTYSAYIIHVAIAKVRIALVRYPVFLADYVFLHTTLGDVTLSYLAATLLCLFVELPITALQKLWIPQLETKRIKGHSDKSLQTIDACESENDLKETSTKI